MTKTIAEEDQMDFWCENEEVRKGVKKEKKILRTMK